MAHLFGWILAAETVPEIIANAMTSVTKNPILILLLINILLLFLGTIMETLAAIILMTPILLPLAQSIGIDPIHFGIIMSMNLAIGMLLIAIKLSKLTPWLFSKPRRHSRSIEH